MPKTKRYDILLVDDHATFRQAAGLLLDAEADMCVAGEAATGEEALELCRERSFDVILLDIHLPDISGIEVARRLIDDGCQAKIIMLSMRDEQEVRNSLPQSVPFLSKSESPATITHTIRENGGA